VVIEPVILRQLTNLLNASGATADEASVQFGPSTKARRRVARTPNYRNN
jgi:hypothetical protein